MKGLRWISVPKHIRRRASPRAGSTGDPIGSPSRRATAARPAVEPLEGRQLLSAALTGTFASLPPSLPAGSADAVALRVSDSGDAPARGSVRIQLYASTDGTLDVADTPLATLSRRLNLKQGSAATVSLPFDVPASLSDGPAGGYYLLARIDAARAGVASSTVVSPAALPVESAYVDLAGRITRLPARPVEFGRRPRLSQMTVEVVNQGNTVARGKLSVTVYLSVSGKLDATAVPLNVSLPRAVKLRPGAKVSLKVPFTAPEGTAPGQYYLLAQVHAAGVAERDLGNNLAASATQVAVVPAPKRTRVGYGWYVGATFYPYDGGYPDLGFYSTSDAYGYPPGPPPTDYLPTPPGDTGTPPTEPPVGPPPAPPVDSSGGSTDTSSSSAGADFGGGGDPGAGNSSGGAGGSSGSSGSGGGGDSGGGGSSDGF